MQAINRPCTYCSYPTSMWCSRCQSAWYCSPEHIHMDWPRHRSECALTNSHDSSNVRLIATPPPAPEPELVTVSALLFAPSEERPKPISVKCRPPHQSAQCLCPTPILDAYFENQPIQCIVLTQGLNGEPLRFPLQVWYAPSLLHKATSPNRAIFHITSGAAEKHWSGPVVVLKYNGSRRQGYSDASFNDLPALSAYFLSYK